MAPSRFVGLLFASKAISVRVKQLNITVGCLSGRLSLDVDQKKVATYSVEISCQIASHTFFSVFFGVTELTLLSFIRPQGALSVHVYARLCFKKIWLTQLLSSLSHIPAYYQLDSPPEDVNNFRSLITTVHRVMLTLGISSLNTTAIHFPSVQSMSIYCSHLVYHPSINKHYCNDPNTITSEHEK